MQQPTPDPTFTGQQIRGAATLAVGTVLSRALGFLRDMLFAYLLGPGADVFLVVFRFPNFFRRMLAEGSLGMAYGAAVSGILALQGHAAAVRFARSSMLLLFLLALPITLTLMLCAQPLAFLLAPGLDQTLLAQAAVLLRLCLPYIPLCLVSSIAFAHAASFGNFRPQAWSASVWNIVLLLSAVTALLTAAPNGGPFTVFASPQAAQTLLCLGVTFGGLAQAALGLRCVQPQVRTRALPLSGTDPKEEHRQLRSFLRQFPAAVLGAAPHQLHLLAGTILASFLATGNISSLYFAERLVELPVSLVGASLGFAVLPRLSMLAAHKKSEDFSLTLAVSVRRSAFLSLPAAAGLFGLALPIADLLFGRGAFDASAVAATAGALQGYALAIPALCAARPLLAAAHALGQRTAPLKSACLSLIPVVLAGLAAVMLWGRHTDPGTAALSGLPVMGITLGLCAGAWINAWLLLRGICSKGITNPLRRVIPALAAYGSAAILLGALLCLFGFSSTDTRPALCLALMAASAMAWLSLFGFLRNEDARAFFSLFLRPRRR